MPNGSLSLPAKLSLLAWNPETGKLTHTSYLHYLVRAGALTELAQRGLLTDADGKTCPALDAVTEDPALDGLLELITESRPRSWKTWVTHQAQLTANAVRDRLAADGYLDASTKRVLVVLPSRSYSLRRADVVVSLRDRAHEVLRGGGSVAEVSPEDAALVALAAAAELRTVVTAKDARTYKGRIGELGEHATRTVPALRKAIADVRAAINVAVMTATVSATTVNT